ncbi:MAG TPA: ABC transporter substrate-binding protein [Stellaceae bacterium]|nr:ABC transporter substrate-binding protein [Stellaceae bacterium]
MRGKLAWAAVALGLIAPAAQAGKPDDTLNLAWSAQIENYDQYFNTVREGIVFAREIWDNLVDRDPRTGEYKPLLAKSYRWVDPLTLDFALRQGISFHDGTPFTATDVAYTLNWLADPANKVITQQNVSWIKSVEETGPFAVRIHLKAPFPAALEYLADILPIYPHDYYAKVGPQGMSRHPVGTGPYKVAAAEPGKSFTLLRNDAYFKESPKGRPAIGRIVQRSIAEMPTQIAELMTGSIDWIWQVPADQAEKLRQVPGVTVKSAETMRIGYVGFDAAGRSGATPVKDRRVREAIAHAIDRAAMVKNLVGGDSRVLDAACFPSQFGCTDEGVKRYAYDPALAKTLLAEAGYPNGFDIDIYAYRERPWAEAIIGYLRAVGIRAKLTYLQYAALRDKNWAGTTPLFYMTWGSNSINDVSAILGNFFTGSPDDFARDAQLKSWIETGDTAIDPAVRKANYRQALQRIAEEIYWLPMFSYVANYAFSADLDFSPDADEVPRFYAAHWK